MSIEDSMAGTDGPFGGPPIAPSPPWYTVRLWAVANGLGAPDRLLLFLHTTHKDVVLHHKEPDPCARALLNALALGSGIGLIDDSNEGALYEMWLAAVVGDAGAFLRVMTEASLLAVVDALFTPPRQKVDDRAASGSWSQPLTDPLYRYSDGTLTPYWPLTPATLRAYQRQTMLAAFHYHPDPDPYAVIGRYWHQRGFSFLASLVDDLSRARAHGSALAGLPCVRPQPVLSGQRAFAAIRDIDAVAGPFVVVIDVTHATVNASISHNGTIVVDSSQGTSGVAPVDDNEMVICQLSGPTERRHTAPIEAWRTLLADLVTVAKAGRAPDVGLSYVPLGTVVARDGTLQPGAPAGSGFDTASEGAHTTALLVGLYDPFDVLAAIKARTPGLLVARIMRSINDNTCGKMTLLKLAARAYRGPLGAGLMPVEVETFVAPYVVARACSASASDADLINLPLAARLLGVEPDFVWDRAALCAEIAEALDPPID